LALLPGNSSRLPKQVAEICIVVYVCCICKLLFCSEKHISLRRMNNVKLSTHREWNPDRLVAIIPLIRPSKTHRLLYVPPGLTLKSSTFYPHGVFMWLVRISEQTAIISLCRINLISFVIETECVYCKVRPGSLYVILCSAPTVCLLSMDLRTNSDYFPIQH
jgi:hypothetical protein